MPGSFPLPHGRRTFLLLGLSPDGWLLAVPALGLPFLLSGGLKIVYDLWIFVLFRHVRPPEEAVQVAKKV